MKSLFFCSLVLVSCGSSTPFLDAGANDASTPVEVDAGLVTVIPPVVVIVDAGVAPSRWPLDAAPITHDVDRSLDAVLEAPLLEGACAAVRAGTADQATRLRCGKWMFFNETFGTVGVPTPLLDFNQKFYGETYFGRGFSQLGFIADPSSTTGMPIGLAPTTGKIGDVETRAFTCAACHFGQMPDGRFAVGYGNLSLDYGRFIASLGAPLSLGFNANDPKVHPRLRSELASAVVTAKARSNYSIEAGMVGLKLLGAGNAGELTIEEQERFLGLRTGTMDFLTKPLVDDGVWTVSRLLPLWNLPNAEQRAAAHMPHEMLAWTGGVSSLEEFLVGFVVIGVGASEWPVERLEPLAEYVRSLRTPALESAEVDVSTGAALFLSAGCAGCHDGPSGESHRTFAFSEIGTDDAYAEIYNPAINNGSPCCGLGGDQTFVTRGVKAPRLAGMPWQTRLLHNGSLDSLEELFCLVPRPMVQTRAQTAMGHMMTCTDLTADEKVAMIGWLRTL